jgi:hypothetical protein
MQRWRQLLPALWAGTLLCLGLLAAPAAFALLTPAVAAGVVGRMLAQEAYASMLLGVVVLVLERLVAKRAVAEGGREFSVGMGLALGTLFCTVASYFAVQPLIALARAGHGAFSFGQLHAISVGFFIVKSALVAALAWRTVADATRSTSS